MFFSQKKEKNHGREKGVKTIVREIKRKTRKDKNSTSGIKEKKAR